MQEIIDKYLAGDIGVSKLSAQVEAEILAKHEASKASMDHLCELVQMWAYERNLLSSENAKSQMLKVVEEVGELAGALSKQNANGIIDGIGDSFVTLIILSKQLGIEPRDALYYAYKEISERNGKMVDGVFIKEEE